MDIARNINSNGKRVTIPLLHKALNKAQRECINDIFHMFVTPITGQDGSSQPLPPYGRWVGVVWRRRRLPSISSTGRDSNVIEKFADR